MKQGQAGSARVWPWRAWRRPADGVRRCGGKPAGGPARRTARPRPTRPGRRRGESRSRWRSLRSGARPGDLGSRGRTIRTRAPSSADRIPASWSRCWSATAIACGGQLLARIDPREYRSPSTRRAPATCGPELIAAEGDSVIVNKARWTPSRPRARLDDHTEWRPARRRAPRPLLAWNWRRCATERSRRGLRAAHRPDEARVAEQRPGSTWPTRDPGPFAASSTA